MKISRTEHQLVKFMGKHLTLLFLGICISSALMSYIASAEELTEIEESRSMETFLNEFSGNFTFSYWVAKPGCSSDSTYQYPFIDPRCVTKELNKNGYRVNELERSRTKLEGVINEAVKETIISALMRPNWPDNIEEWPPKNNSAESIIENLKMGASSLYEPSIRLEIKAGISSQNDRIGINVRYDFSDNADESNSYNRMTTVVLIYPINLKWCTPLNSVELEKCYDNGEYLDKLFREAAEDLASHLINDLTGQHQVSKNNGELLAPTYFLDFTDKLQGLGVERENHNFMFGREDFDEGNISVYYEKSSNAKSSKKRVVYSRYLIIDKKIEQSYRDIVASHKKVIEEITAARKLNKEIIQ